MGHVSGYPFSIDTLEPFPRNPRIGDITAVAASLTRFGQLKPVVVDGNRIVAGHHVVAAARDRLGWTQIAVAANEFASEDEQRAFLLADNRTGDLGSYDNALLAEQLQALARLDALEGTGYDGDDLDDILKDLRRLVIPEQDPDAVPEPPPEPRSKFGEVYELGPHRLMCGDATDPETVAALLGREKPLLCVTDPPYGVAYDPGWRDEAAAKGHLAPAARRTGEVANDDRVDWSAAWILIPGNVLYCWHASLFGPATQQAIKAAGFELRSQIIWAKTDHFAISRGHYHWRHEACWYAVRAGASAHWIGDRSQTTLWEEALDRNVEGGHSTQKPVAIMGRPLDNHAGDVYDPFCGSGSTLIAAEMRGRRCYAMELAPAYCDVIRQRYADFTGQPQYAPVRL